MVDVVQRIGVHAGRGQPGDGVDQRVLGADRDVVRLHDRAARVDRDLAFGPEGTADPAQPDPPGGQHARGGPQCGLGLLRQGRVHAIHQPPADLAGRLPADHQDGHRDEQAHHRVGPAPADRHPARPGQHRQRGKPVGPGVQAVGDQRRRADPAAGPDPVAGDQFVAGEAEGGRDRDGGQVGDRVRVQQPADGGERGRSRGEHDNGHDDDAGQVLGPAVAIGVAAGGAPPAEQERDAERHRGQRVGRVVQRVAEERDRTGQHDHRRLRERGRAQRGQRDPQGTQAFRRGFEHRVDRAVVVVRMRPDGVPDAGPALVCVVMPVFVPVAMLVLMLVIVLVAVVVLVAAWVLLVAHPSSMARETRCSISTPATRTRLRTPRSYADNREHG